MKLTVAQGGGFAGLVRTVSADSASLAPEHAEELRRRVEASGLLGLPPRLGAAADHADRIDYAVTVEDGDRRHTVVTSADAVPDGVRSLISWLDSVPGHQEQLGPPGTGAPAG
jgi:hypothetical protein